jgi:RNA polymerase sigma factor (sigma-70 family)
MSSDLRGPEISVSGLFLFSSLADPAGGGRLAGTSQRRRQLSGTAPIELGQLLQDEDSGIREAAWDGLIARHTRLLMAVARSFGGDHDASMDRYAYLIEKLRERDFRRLRSFNAVGVASFSTWLTVAARRLCLDHHRSLYGRSRDSYDAERVDAARVARKRLTDSISAELDVDDLPDVSESDSDARIFRTERDACLRRALDELPPRDRLLLALRFEDGMSASRISNVLGLPTAFHAYRRLNAVLKSLRAALETCGIDGPDG